MLTLFILALQIAMQALELVTIPRTAQDVTKANTQMDEYIGVIVPFEDSMNTLFNLKHLTDPDMRYVYWYSYTFGKRKRGVLWGVYDKLTQKFSLDNACNQYDMRILNEARKEWKRNDFVDSGNSIVDRIHGTMNKYLTGVRNATNSSMIDELGEQTGIYMGSTPPISRDEYIKDKYILAYYKHKPEQEEIVDARHDPLRTMDITRDTLQQRFGEDVIGRIEDDLAKEIYMRDYVVRPKRRGSSRSKRSLREVYDYELADVPVKEEYEELPPEPYSEIYESGFFENYDLIISSKDYEDALQAKLNKIYADIKLYERVLNRTDTNSIIAGEVRGNVGKILNRFYQFLKTGVYTSDGYLTALQKCPYLAECELDPQKECALYFHGRYSNFLHENDMRDLDEYVSSLV